MERTAKFYPQQSFDPQTFAEWLISWVRMAKETSFTRFEAGVLLARDKSLWFPLPAAIEECIPESEVRIDLKADENCAHCGGSGQKSADNRTQIQVMRSTGKDRFPRYTRCHCVRRVVEAA